MTTARRTAAAVAAPARPSGDELLDRINPQKRTADCYVILSGDVLDEWETEDNKLKQMRADQLEQKGGRLAAGNEPTEAIKRQAKKVQALEAKIEDRQMHFVFQNMEPAERSLLAASFPPRKGNQFDALAGYDREALETASVRLCLIEPVFSDEGWERLMGVIPPGEWQELVRTCNEANGRVGQLPKSEMAALFLPSRNGNSLASPSGSG
jgi:hypothetical protein